MQTVQNSYRSLSLLMSLNFDRILIPLAILVGLAGGALIGAQLAEIQSLPTHTQF